MKVLSPASLWLVLGCCSLFATLVQCGDRNGRAQSPGAAATQDPRPVLPPPDRLRLLISGAMSGRLEPCGCASGQLGGLARRMQHVGEQRTFDLLLEVGDLVDGSTELDLLKFFTTKQVLFDMERPYDALGVGAKDLLLPRAEWNAFLGGPPPVPVVASNLACSEPDWPGKPFVEKQVRGITVRVASLLLALPEALRAEGAPVKLLPPADGWRAALAGADADARRIVMVHGDEAAIRKLIPQLEPSPDLVIGVDPGWVEPGGSPLLVGNVPLVFAGIRGRVLLDVWLHRDAKGPHAVCELVPLAGSKTVPGGGGDPQVKDVILDHRRQVKDDDVLGKMARQLPTPNGAAYVGTSQCKVCHLADWEVWSKSKHAVAWETLVDAEKDPKRYGWPVTAYPDCVSCHVVGHREQTGFVSFEDTPDLADVGCERCHGPGSDHMASGGKKKLGIIGGIAPSLLCIQCHDFEQSPTFVYGERWPKIEHGKKK